MKARLSKLSGPKVGDGKGQQWAPVVDREDVFRVVVRDFPANLQRQVFAILGEYRPTESENLARVQLAALKLADGDMDRLITQIAVAVRDWRDVVSAAEYPGYSREPAPSKLTEAERRRIIRADSNQYHAWLDR